MQIDPRTAKQLIEFQLMSGIDLQGTALQNTTSTGGSNSAFNMVLQQLMQSDSASASENEYSSAVSLGQTINVNGQLWQLIQANTEGTTDVSSVSADSSHGVQPAPVLTRDHSADHKSRPTDYNDLISKASRDYGVPESLIKAVIDTESSFNPNSVSSAGAKGLMQLMDGTARGLGVSNSFDPAQNIDGGTKYISYQLKRYDGNLSTAMAAYNAGPGTLRKLGISNDKELMEKLHLLPVETQKYVTKIDRARAKYEV
ncbi:lytic transglycosylase domain-containing protein [Paenibacillus sp. YPG26]|uniref:lytic transglycosylase domain-containing protein n=1 Tax=Paenibacillus sp. YPG26 TaxID=2878915 RepID=UPI00204005BF|nr:lytic transglycosylase domain-containing protein [Paenibacillus sp. YPG26]USB34473.1 lytic transglycosylase domain-containing protein [Paenibacillus sp. YPG26]